MAPGLHCLGSGSGSIYGSYTHTAGAANPALPVKPTRHEFISLPYCVTLYATWQHKPMSMDASPPPPPKEREAGPATYLDAATSIDTIAAIRAGISTNIMDEFKERLDITDAKLSEILRIPKRTLSRRRQEGQLRPDESERVLRLLHVVRHAERVLGSTKEARQWMREPNFALGNETPLQFCDTGPGARRVDQLLGQIAHGIAT